MSLLIKPRYGVFVSKNLQPSFTTNDLAEARQVKATYDAWNPKLNSYIHEWSEWSDETI